MLTILLRTIIIYVILSVIMRLMGKRQIGELEVTDLVTTLLISEIAALPVTNQDIPLSHAVIPMITVLFLEMLSSVILIRFPTLKNLVSARPTVIINGGRLDQKALCNLRISIDELISEIRQQGYSDLSQIDCAILEKNGKLTVVPKGEYGQPTVGQLGLSVKDGGLMHIVFSNGKASGAGLSLIGKDEAWLERQLRRREVEPADLFCATANSSGAIYLIRKETK